MRAGHGWKAVSGAWGIERTGEWESGLAPSGVTQEAVPKNASIRLLDARQPRPASHTTRTTEASTAVPYRTQIVKSHPPKRDPA